METVVQSKIIAGMKGTRNILVDRAFSNYCDAKAGFVTAIDNDTNFILSSETLGTTKSVCAEKLEAKGIEEA